MKLSFIQKFMLLCAALAYAGFLIFFLRAQQIGVLTCGVLSGGFFLMVLYFGMPPEKDGQEDDSDAVGGEQGPRIHVDNLIEQLTDAQDRAEAVKEELSLSIKRIAELESEAELLQEDKEEQKRQLDELHRQMEEKQGKADEMARQLEEERQQHEESRSQLDDALRLLSETRSRQPFVRQPEENRQDEAKRAREERGRQSSFEASLLPIEEGEEAVQIDLADVAESAAKELHALTQKAGISVKIVSAQKSLQVKASERMLNILFRNIIDNAIKYMNREGILQITLSEVEEELFIICKDNGEGLAKDETGHIFELNYQGSNRVSGNGLGLAQARAIVEYYGGIIYARSTEGAGMGIYIHLPSVTREAEK